MHQHFKHCYTHEGHHCSCGAGRVVATLADAHRAVNEELVQINAAEADRVRGLMELAVAQRDAEFIRSEGRNWSGSIGLAIFRLADRVEEAANVSQQHPRTTGLEDMHVQRHR